MWCYPTNGFGVHLSFLGQLSDTRKTLPVSGYSNPSSSVTSISSSGAQADWNHQNCLFRADDGRAWGLPSVKFRVSRYILFWRTTKMVSCLSKMKYIPGCYLQTQSSIRPSNDTMTFNKSFSYKPYSSSSTGLSLQTSNRHISPSNPWSCWSSDSEEKCECVWPQRSP